MPFIGRRGEQRYLDLARKGADQYLNRRIEQMQTGFDDPDAKKPFFWTSFAPKWIDLTELYEATGERKYLEAAVEGARRFAMFVWLCPHIPDEEILVNKGGNAPVYWYLKSKGHKPMKAPEERVPAWRLSEIGLTSESSGTSTGHRAIFMANYAPWLLRLGHYANDRFLRDVARSAIVGRYANFPGYHINTARTTIYEKPDYPLRPHQELSVNSFHYNHIWPMASMLLDYLVTDAFVRSEGKITFPSHFIEGYAYLQNKFYGDRPGRFYEATNLFLWMPRNLVQTDSVELNYIAARGDRELRVALMNQSPQSIETRVALNAGIVGFNPAQTFEVSIRENNGAPKRATLRRGELRLTVAPMGITTLEIEGIHLQPAFQQKLAAASPDDAWSRDYVKLATGDARAMVLNFGPASKSVFAYLREDDSRWKGASLRYAFDDQNWSELTDDAYPFEFTVPLPAGAKAFDFELLAVSQKDGRTVKEKGRLVK